MPVIPYTIVPSQGSDQADEWMRLGFDAQSTGNLPLAQKRYGDCLRLNPRHALAMNNLAVVFAQSNLLNEALLTIERASMCDTTHAVIPQNWALVAMDLERVNEAVVQARRAAEMAPSEVGPKLLLALLLPSAGKPEESVALYNQILDKEPAHPSAGINAAFVQTLTDAGPQEMLRQRHRWYEGNRFKGAVEPHKNDKLGASCPQCRPYPGTVGAFIVDPTAPPCDKCGGTGHVPRVLRVGYVGGDFKSHSAAFIFRRVLFHHTPAVEPYFYSTLPVDPAADAQTKRFQEVAGPRWRDISTTSDADAAALIRRDGIDILVDLAAHTNGGRLALFAHKPAPVQATGWGFAHGTGLPEVDYFLACPVSVPPEERQHYSEKIVDLPCLVTMEPIDEYDLKATSSPPLRANGCFTFGSFCRYEKVSEACLAVFAEILRRVPDARLLFKDNALRRPDAIRRVQALMPGIEPERLLFSTATSHSDHMLAYQQADLALDPFPHCGGIVSLEQLFMGLPILTLLGNKPAGRNTASVLSAMGRGEWIAKSPEEYVAKAVATAENPKEILAARKTLRRELLDSPVVKDYHLAYEAALRTMWKEWCAK